MTEFDLFEQVAPGERTKLIATTCSACGRTEFPAAAGVCPACRCPVERVALPGPALLVGKTSVLAQPPGAKVQAPYDVGVAEFPERVRIIGLLAGPGEVGDTVVPVAHSAAPDLVTFAFRRTPISGGAGEALVK